MGQSVYPEPSVTSSGEMVDGVQSFGGAEMHRVFLVCYWRVIPSYDAISSAPTQCFSIHVLQRLQLCEVSSPPVMRD